MNMKGNRVPLRLASSKCFGGRLEICNDVFEQGIPVFYNDSRIEAFSFDNGTDATNPTLYVDASMTGAS